MNSRRFFLLTSFIFVGAPIQAQQQSTEVAIENALVAEAARAVAGGPKIDGVLDDEAWALAPLYGGFVQRDPNEGEVATERTEFRVLYTNEALYIGVRAFDTEADRIKSILSRRDEQTPSDMLGVMIDSYNDKRTAFQFVVNPAGVKMDAFLYDDEMEDDRWDAVWDVGVTVDSEGWTAEFKIPFSQLRFTEADMNTFGFNVARVVNRLNEESYWQPLPKAERGKVSRFGELTGIRGVVPPRRLEVLPYTVARSARSGTEVVNAGAPVDPFRDGWSNRPSFGADVKFGVSSALTLSATINPDFGQVEADPAVVNLSAQETFFPERRPFFTEGLDIFRFRLSDGDGDNAVEELFYTRRIGRLPQGAADPRGGFVAPPTNTTILAAGKLSGKTQNGWTIGITGALTDEEDAEVIDVGGATHFDVVEPRSGYLIGRLAKDMREGKTQVGFFGTAVQRSLPQSLEFLRSSAYTGGINWTHRFADDRFQFSGRAVASHVLGSPEAIAITQRSSVRYYQRPDADHLTYDPTRTSLSGFTFATSIGKLSGNWRGAAGIDTRSPGFEVNDVGFQHSADQIMQWTWLNRRWLEPGKVFRRFNVNMNQWSGFNYGGERIGVGGNVNANFMLLNYWNGFFGVNRNQSSLATRQLRGGPAITRPGAWNGWMGFQSDSRKAFRGGMNGWFFLQDENDSWGTGISANLSWRPASNMDFTASPGFNLNQDEWQYLRAGTVNGNTEYIFADLDQRTFYMTFRGNMTFSPTLTLQAYMQPFMSSGRYGTLRRVSNPQAEPFWNQFEELTSDQILDAGTGLASIDFDRDGTADMRIGNPDFTYLSFRSNLVLRWEYLLGSTLFVVWQHGRSGYGQIADANIGSNAGALFSPNPADGISVNHENVFLVKINYWLNP